jgi:hypothetical protein
VWSRRGAAVVTRAFLELSRRGGLNAYAEPLERSEGQEPEFRQDVTLTDEGRFTSVLPHYWPKEDGQGYACERAFGSRLSKGHVSWLGGCARR